MKNQISDYAVVLFIFINSKKRVKNEKIENIYRYFSMEFYLRG